MIEMLLDREHGVLRNISEISAVGHRAVHGGIPFTGSVLRNKNERFETKGGKCMTQDKTTEEQVIEIVARVFHKEVAVINRDTRFIDDLFAKSINFVELLAVLEYELGISAIPVSKARQMNTVGKAIDLVVSLLDK